MSATVHIMGILNVTPDSFSDGGRFCTGAALADRIGQLLAQGADSIDVGGESTRPFAQPVGAAEELARVLPAIRAIRQQSRTIPISIDTTKARVAAEALEAGATMINDISALRQDPEMIQVARSFPGPVIIMHMQGTPGTMQLNPHYADVIGEINRFFALQLQWLEGEGIDRARVIVDPGLGFGKSLEHNLAILRHVRAFGQHCCPVLIGHSRKSLFGQLLDCPVKERDCPTAVVSALCTLQGVDILRVHDVRSTRQAVRLAQAMGAGDGAGEQRPA